MKPKLQALNSVRDFQNPITEAERPNPIPQPGAHSGGSPDMEEANFLLLLLVAVAFLHEYLKTLLQASHTQEQQLSRNPQAFSTRLLGNSASGTEQLLDSPSL